MRLIEKFSSENETSNGNATIGADFALKSFQCLKTENSSEEKKKDNENFKVNRKRRIVTPVISGELKNPESSDDGNSYEEGNLEDYFSDVLEPIPLF
mmetsp:Transcript_11347/g.17486  ORF Transcript_11347/g.17486 Transcript_11347/m.17486 type:complete len:97 (+) Transcript_11347:155-445(+)